MRKVLCVATIVFIITSVFAQHYRSWWCSDEVIEGYYNCWLQGLTTPDIALPAAPDGDLELSFMLNYKVEDPPTGLTEVSPWDFAIDGWDAANVLISTDGGDTWEVLETEDGYTCDIMYGFIENGEYELLAGWGGTNRGWEEQIADLSEYAGQLVRIRFVFGSDPAYCTIDDDGLYGVLVDEITVKDASHTYFYDPGGNGGAPTEMVTTNLVPKVVASNARSYNGTQSAFARNLHKKYYRFISPSVHIPERFLATAGYWIYRDIPDSLFGTEYLGDYYYIWLSTNGGASWDELIAADWHHGDIDPEWTFVHENVGLRYVNPGLMLYDYIGEDVMLKFEFWFDQDDDNGLGEGVYIDGFCIYGYEGYSYDVGVTDIFPSPINLGSATTFNIRVTGFGVETMNAPLYYQLYYEGTPVTSGPLGTVVSVPFRGNKYRSLNYTPTEAGIYTIVAWTNAALDENRANDTLYWNFVVPDEHHRELGFDDGLQDSFYSATTERYYYYIQAGTDTFEEVGDGYAVDFISPFPETHLGAISIRGRGDGDIVFGLFEMREDGPDDRPEMTWTVSLPPEGLREELFVFELPSDYIIPFDSFLVAVWSADMSSFFWVGVDVTAPHTGNSWFIESEGSYYLFENMTLYPDPYGQFDYMLRIFVWEPGGKSAWIGPRELLPQFRSQRKEATTEEEYDTLYWTSFEVDSGGVDSWGPWADEIYWHITSNPSYVYMGGGIDKERRPIAFSLAQNKPNPFNSSTEISFSIDRSADVSLIVYDVMGKEVCRILNEKVGPGNHRITWNGKDNDGNDIPSGIYMYRLIADGRIATRMMSIIR